MYTTEAPELFEGISDWKGASGLCDDDVSDKAADEGLEFLIGRSNVSSEAPELLDGLSDSKRDSGFFGRARTYLGRLFKQIFDCDVSDDEVDMGLAFLIGRPNMSSSESVELFEGLSVSKRGSGLFWRACACLGRFFKTGR